MSETLAERLEAVRKAIDLSQQQFAVHLGTTISTYQRYANGQSSTIKSEQLETLKALGVDLNWLICGEGQRFAGVEPPEASPEQHPEQDPKITVSRRVAASSAGASPPEAPEGFVLVPRYDVHASAGHGALVEGEAVLDFMAFQESWVRRTLRVDPHRLALITATGDSMEPAIRSGDLLLIDTSVDRVMDDSIYLISHHEILLVKRIQLLFDGVVVKSDNSNYLEMTLGPAEMDRLLIRGRVRWIGRLI